MEQDNITPDKGWKAYYASTKAVVTVNAEFFNVITERSAGSMRRLWLNADYVKCILGTGQFGVSLSGYVMDKLVGVCKIAEDNTVAGCIGKHQVLTWLFVLLGTML